MPRTSKKSFALEAAYNIIEKHGVEGVTFDSLAEATGMSKSGLIYHFPSRHHLLTEIHKASAARWEATLEETFGGAHANELSRTDKERAMLHSAGVDCPVGELLLNIHALNHEDYIRPWNEVDERWLPDPSQDIETEDDYERIEGQLLGVGLWVHDHLSGKKLSKKNRAMVVERLLKRIAQREKRNQDLA